MDDNYVINRGLKEWKINPKFFNSVLQEKCRNFNINPKSIKFYSQQDEDKYIIQKILKKPVKDGVFLEAGAMDGVTYNNTKTLEDFFGFTGILIEPVPSMYNKLIKNRPKCKNFNCTVSDIENEKVKLIGKNACAGIVDFINDGSKNQLSRTDINNPYQVKNFSLTEIIKKSGFEYIDIMSIDVEGGELSFLKSFDFKIPVLCIIIEAHSDEQDKNKIFGDYLISKNFTFMERQRGNEIWMNKNYHRLEYFNLINNSP